MTAAIEANEKKLDIGEGTSAQRPKGTNFRFDFFATSPDESQTRRVGLSRGSRWRTSLKRVFGDLKSPFFFQGPSSQEHESHLASKDVEKRRQLLQQLDAKVHECAHFADEIRSRRKGGQKPEDGLADRRFPEPISVTSTDAFLMRPELYSHACHRGFFVIVEKGRQTTIFTGGVSPHEASKRMQLAEGHHIISRTDNHMVIRPETKEGCEAVEAKARELGYFLIMKVRGEDRQDDELGKQATTTLPL